MARIYKFKQDEVQTIINILTLQPYRDVFEIFDTIRKQEAEFEAEEKQMEQEIQNGSQTV